MRYLVLLYCPGLPKSDDAIKKNGMEKKLLKSQIAYVNAKLDLHGLQPQLETSIARVLPLSI